MSAINFILDKYAKLDEAPILGMNKALSRRGPDSSSYHAKAIENYQVFIGHNRLKIIDLRDESNQPFLSLDRDHLISFNGEIYNYKHLRKTLEKEGHVFYTRSDTEVLLKTLIQYGVEGIKMLDGMFAFVWFNMVDDEIIVARDRMGVKPLYYVDNDDYTVFSSELKGIFGSGLIKKEFNATQIPNYLLYQHVRKP